MGYVPPTYSPKYNEVAREYMIHDSTTSDNSQQHIVAARAATTVAPWDIVVESMYQSVSAPMLKSFKHWNVGRLQDTYDWVY